MSYAELLPVKVPVVEAVPPPSEEYWNKLPTALKPKRSYTDADKKKLQEDFERRANNDYYSEWFWFPYSNQAWVNTWKNTDDPNGKIDDWPGKLAVGAQFVEAITMQGFQKIGEVVGNSGIPQIGLAKGLPMFVTNLICEYQYFPASPVKLTVLSELCDEGSPFRHEDQDAIAKCATLSSSNPKHSCQRR